MRVITLLTIFLFGLGITLLGCSSSRTVIEEKLRLESENKWLKKDNEHLKAENSQLRKEISLMKTGLSDRRSSMAAPLPVQKTRPTGINLTEENIAPQRLQRCRQQVKKTNAAIEILTEAYMKKGNGSWQYALSYQMCQDKVDALKEFTDEYDTEVKPNLLPLPTAPTSDAQDKLAEMVLAEQKRLEEEKARQDEINRQERQHKELMDIESAKVEAQKREAAAAEKQAKAQQDIAKAQAEQAEAQKIQAQAQAAQAAAQSEQAEAISRLQRTIQYGW